MTDERLAEIGRAIDQFAYLLRPAARELLDAVRRLKAENVALRKKATPLDETGCICHRADWHRCPVHEPFGRRPGP
jgi:hypothetical protein